MAFLAYHDPLTGLPNRAQLSESVSAAIEQARRTNRSVGLLCLDLDDFKLVNDSLGHPVGDELLVSIARRLEALKRHGDLLGAHRRRRVLPAARRPARPTAWTHAMTTASRVAAALAEPVEVEGAEFHVSASLGVSVFPRLAAGGRRAAAPGRHRHVPGQAGRARGAHGLHARGAASARPAVADRAAAPLHRPRRARAPLPADLRPRAAGSPWPSRRCCAGTIPSRGLVPPAAFIPAAEHSGLIEPIGEWVLDELCRQAAEWRELGLTPRLSVNAAPRELRRRGVRGVARAPPWSGTASSPPGSWSR